ncbi:MAG: bifunctional acetate--CoA ligase family protein/GNAT family N-acetyltransferase [Actinomycetes bacterium]
MTITTPGSGALDQGWEGLAADGRIVRIRPAGADDEAALHALCERSSDRSLYLRFFSMNRRAADGYLASLARPVDEGHVSLVAEVAGQVVAVAGWEREAADVAEVALLVEDEHQGRGIGTLLLEELAARARKQGIERLVADTLTENRRMLEVFSRSGLHGANDQHFGVVHTVLTTSLDDQALALIDDREATAEVASLEPLFAPRHLAVIGASRRPGGVGREVLRSILDGGFTGGVHVVNPNALEVAGLPSYAHVSEVPVPIDLAIVAVPRDHVVEVMQECGEAGVRAAVVLTSGLGEAGSEGSLVQRQMLEVARRHGMRLVGPNCIGLVNTDPTVRLEAWFAATTPLPGRLAVATQSGAVGIAIADHARRSGLGIASLVSLGNKVDVSGNDLLLRWWQDPRVSVIALYLESLGNPRKFARLARRVGARTPVLVVKGGRSAGGQRAGKSHTAAASSPDTAVDALFAQAGVLRMETVEELVDVARLLDSQPLPAGGRLAVIGNGGGVGVLAADAAQMNMLQVPSLSDDLRSAMGPQATDNPVDLGALASPALLRRVLELTAASGEIDALLVTVAVTRTNDPEAMLSAIGEADVGDLPLLVTVSGAPHDVTSVPLVHGGAAPVYSFPEAAVRALGRAAQYARWRRTPPGLLPSFPDLSRERVRDLVCAVLAEDPEGRWTDAQTTHDLLTSYGIAVAPTRRASSADEAAAAAEQLGFPVVLKTDVADVLHKTDVEGVRTGLAEASQVRRAYDDVVGRLGGGVLLQPTVEAIAELVIGVTRESSFGPVVMVGLGGVFTDVLGDRTFRLVPLTDLDAREMLLGLRAAPLLQGYRGSAPADLVAVEDPMLRLSTLAQDVPELAELDLNPVMVGSTGAVAVDAKLRLSPPSQIPDDIARSLRR